MREGRLTPVFDRPRTDEPAFPLGLGFIVEALLFLYWGLELTSSTLKSCHGSQDTNCAAPIYIDAPKLQWPKPCGASIINKATKLMPCHAVSNALQHYIATALCGPA